MVFRVAVTDGFELELSIETREPSSETQKHLREWRMDIKVVLALDVVRRELSEVNLIESEREILVPFDDGR